MKGEVFFMGRMVGTVSRGIRTPIIKAGDDLVKIVADSVLEAADVHNFEVKDRDIIAINHNRFLTLCAE